MSNKDYPVCCDCGSEEVTATANVTWNKEKEDWEVQDIWNDCGCDGICEGESEWTWKSIYDSDREFERIAEAKDRIADGLKALIGGQ